MRNRVTPASQQRRRTHGSTLQPCRHCACLTAHLMCRRPTQRSCKRQKITAQRVLTMLNAGDWIHRLCFGEPGSKIQFCLPQNCTALLYCIVLYSILFALKVSAIVSTTGQVQSTVLYLRMNESPHQEANIPLDYMLHNVPT